MNLLFYLSHPAQFHFYKFIIGALQAKGYKTVVLIKTKDVLEELIASKGWEYQNIQPKPRKSTPVSIFGALIRRTFLIWQIARKSGVGLLIGTDASVAHAAFLLRKESLTILEDDYRVIPLLAWLTYPFTSAIVTPDCCDVGRWKSKKIGYQGYMKLAYLHPDYFTPTFVKLKSYGLPDDYVLIRMVSLSAHHDAGVAGLTVELVETLVGVIHDKGLKVCISSENQLPEHLVGYQLSIEANDMHQVLAGARLLISDSQSMSVEAAVLGVPSVRFSGFTGRISVLEELEHQYQLTFGLPASSPQKLLKQTRILLSDDTLRLVFERRRQTLLRQKIDVTRFMVDLIQKMSDVD